MNEKLCINVSTSIFINKEDCYRNIYACVKKVNLFVLFSVIPIIKKITQ